MVVLSRRVVRALPEGIIDYDAARIVSEIQLFKMVIQDDYIFL
jgi:hypothetical protein